MAKNIICSALKYFYSSISIFKYLPEIILLNNKITNGENKTSSGKNFMIAVRANFVQYFFAHFAFIPGFSEKLNF